jgi:hypothetical protein
MTRDRPLDRELPATFKLLSSDAVAALRALRVFALILKAWGLSLPKGVTKDFSFVITTEEGGEWVVLQPRDWISAIKSGNADAYGIRTSGKIILIDAVLMKQGCCPIRTYE